MFKKPSDVDVSRSSALGGKDVKKLKSRCLALLPNLIHANPSRHIQSTPAGVPTSIITVE